MGCIHTQFMTDSDFYSGKTLIEPKFMRLNTGLITEAKREENVPITGKGSF